MFNLSYHHISFLVSFMLRIFHHRRYLCDRKCNLNPLSTARLIQLENFLQLPRDVYISFHLHCIHVQLFVAHQPPLDIYTRPSFTSQTCFIIFGCSILFLSFFSWSIVVFQYRSHSIDEKSKIISKTTQLFFSFHPLSNIFL